MIEEFMLLANKKSGWIYWQAKENIYL
jgi:hypothetical protein